MDNNLKQDRTKWFPYTYSRYKNDLIYLNSILNCQSEYGCTLKKECEHDPKWQILDIKNFLNQENYDFLALGCSVSYGCEIKKKETWAGLVAESYSVANLSFPGAGIDAIFNNLKILVENTNYRFKKIILLLPTLYRKTFKIKKQGLWFNFPLNVNHNSTRKIYHPNFAFRPQEMEKIEKNFHIELIKSGEIFGKKVLLRLLKWLKSNNLNFYISSWDDDVYDILKKECSSVSLLPKFNRHYKRDLSIGHPSSDAHRHWFEQIKNQIL